MNGLRLIALGTAVVSAAEPACAVEVAQGFANAAPRACSYPPPPVAPSLAAPADGAAGVATALRAIVVQEYIPSGNVSLVPNPDEQRVVLVDPASYPAEGGILRLADEREIPDPRPTLAPLGAAASAGAIRFLSTWAPPLRPNAHYEVRIQLPYQGSCLYATVGSFTTADQPPQR